MESMTINIFAKRFLGREFLEEMKFHNNGYVQTVLDKATDMGKSDIINDIHAFRRFDFNEPHLGQELTHFDIIKKGKIIYSIEINNVSNKTLKVKRKENLLTKEVFEYRNWKSYQPNFDKAVEEVIMKASLVPKIFKITNLQ